MKDQTSKPGKSRAGAQRQIFPSALLSAVFVATAAVLQLTVPALAQNDPKTIYSNALATNAASGRYWLAIQYGGILDREGLLDPAASVTLARTYTGYGSYSDAERIAQSALDRGTGDEKQRKQLSDIVSDAQIRQGKREASFGQSLFNSLLSGAAAGLAEGLTGQQVDASTSQPANAAQRQAASQQAERQAQQRAASELMSEDAGTLRTVYADLTDDAARLSAADRKRAKRILDSASNAYGRDEFTSAQSSLHDVLAIDPTNATANYYYADCLARGSNDSLQAIDYLARALAFDRDGESRSLAMQALQGIVSAAQGAGQN
ncbi:MAG TPA: hypothetical protein VGL35_09375 [Rhizomicrobium sp.]|jgi:hypothetical protein